jgi:hypothetical protein
MSDKKALIDLKTKIIKYIKHIIKTSSAIDEEEIKKYFIFWLYLTDLTNTNTDIAIDNEALNDDEKRIVNNLVQRVIDYNNRKKSRNNPNTTFVNKPGYFSTKFYLDCGLYNIEGLTYADYQKNVKQWYDEFVNVNNTEEYKNCMKINIVSSTVPLGTVDVHKYARTQKRNQLSDLIDNPNISGQQNQLLETYPPVNFNSQGQQNQTVQPGNVV